MLICGIDPGLAITGYAALRADGPTPTIVDAGVCRFDERLPLHERLVHVEHDVSVIFEEHRPALVAVEELYAHYKHPRTAILMGHARGVILLAAARMGIELRSYSATRVKRFICGRGQAGKDQVQRAIQAALRLPRLPEPPDVADALALALCCAADINAARALEAAR